MRKVSILAIAAGTAAILAMSAIAQEKQFVNIGTAGIGDGYYPTGGGVKEILLEDGAPPALASRNDKITLPLLQHVTGNHPARRDDVYSLRPLAAQYRGFAP